MRTSLTRELEACGRPAVGSEYLWLMKGGHARDGGAHPVRGCNNPTEEEEKEHDVPSGQLKDGR